MELINYLLMLLITFSGLFVGMILAYIAPEEMKPGEKHHKFIQTILFSAFLGVYAYHALSSWIFGVIVFIVLGILLTYKKISSRAAYLFFGIVIAFSTEIKQILILESIVVFFYGFVTGTLFMKNKINKPKLEVLSRLILNYGFYFILPIAIYLINLVF